MIPNRKVTTAALVVEMSIGLLVMAGSVSGGPTFISTCPTVISSPGDYVLSADLICGGGGGITITSSDVTLKLEGHRITAGDGANMGVSSAISNISGPGRPSIVANVHILGPGLITNGGENAFNNGVLLGGTVARIEVRGITVLGSRFAGINLSGVAGFSSLQMTLAANTLGRNGTGISVINLDAGSISKNDVSGNGTGILIENDDVAGLPTMVSHNIVNGNTGDGVRITDLGPLLIPTVAVQNNVISGNGGNGISVLVALEVTNNTSLANGMFDLFASLPGCTEPVWSGNTFFTANQSCIH
jgi:hypothetical protein